MKNLYLLVLLSFLVSCAPKQYGRYFSHSPYETKSEQKTLDKEELPELLTALDDMTTLGLQIDTVLEQDDSKLAISREIFSQDAVDNKTQLMDNQDSTFNIAAKPELKADNRKAEPLGIAGLFSFLISIVVMVAFWGAAAVIPVAIFFGLALLLGILSGIRIKLKPEKWKGSGFSIFIKIISLILLISFGLFTLLLVATVD